MKPPPTYDREEELTLFLAEHGAAEIEHSGRTLLAHLVGTAELLAEWGERATTCQAGLFHSVYGTAHFRRALFGERDRPKLRALLGEEVERIVWMFSRRERDPVALTDFERHALRRIAEANEKEQAPHLSRAHPHALAALLASNDPLAILGDSWPNELFVQRGPVERLTGLVTHDLPALVAMKKHHTTAFFRSLEGAPSHIPVRPGQERELYDAGFTLYFHGLASPEIARWVSALDRELGLVRGATRVAAFASKKGRGLEAHFDQNDNFVCQARGTKKWRVAKNTSVKWPSAGYTIGAPRKPIHELEAPHGFPSALPSPHETIVMEPGTVMFMPRGTWHDTETTDGESLHFNIQCGVATIRDVLEHALTQHPALFEEALRAPMTHVFASDGQVRAELAPRLKEHLATVVDRIAKGDLVLDREELERFVARRRARDD